MSAEYRIPILRASLVEVHYWFANNTHTMDAFVQNKCEYEILGIIREISNTLNVHISIETEPLAEGGLRRWFRIVSKDEGKRATILVTVITALLTTVIVTPISTSITKLTEKAIERIFEDPEIRKLEKEKLKLEVEKLRRDIEKGISYLDSNHVVKKKRSNFYEYLDKYPKVDKVSFIVSDTDKSTIIEEKDVHRQNFREFILVSDELDPEYVEDAVIEIISPVLKKGNYKWMGIYNGESVTFSMKSTEFKELVQQGKIQFKNGTSINCGLVKKRKIDNEGIAKVTNIEVYRVNEYFENDKPIETPEGRKHRKERQAENQQLKLFSDNI